MPIYFLLVISVFFKCTYYMVFFSISLILEFNFRSRSKGSNFLNEVSCKYIHIHFFCYLKKPRNISDKNQHNYVQKIHPKKRNTTYFFALFRPPFINGRPQDSVSVFGKALVPFFEAISPCFFHLFFHLHHF